MRQEYEEETMGLHLVLSLHTGVQSLLLQREILKRERRDEISKAKQQLGPISQRLWRCNGGQ
jgi:hypothetical protein